MELAFPRAPMDSTRAAADYANRAIPIALRAWAALPPIASLALRVSRTVGAPAASQLAHPACTLMHPTCVRVVTVAAANAVVATQQTAQIARVMRHFCTPAPAWPSAPGLTMPLAQPVERAMRAAPHAAVQAQTTARPAQHTRPIWSMAHARVRAAIRRAPPHARRSTSVQLARITAFTCRVAQTAPDHSNAPVRLGTLGMASRAPTSTSALSGRTSAAH